MSATPSQAYAEAGIIKPAPGDRQDDLKCFDPAIAASGLRMAYETYNQLLGRGGPRQLAPPSIGVTHNLSGVPYLGVAAISILRLH